ncbi:MAG: hypothetical protein ACR2G2_12000 [Pseudonocardia sp.]
MSRLNAALIVFALALVALGIYGIAREKSGENAGGTTTAAAPAAPAAAPAPAAGVDLTAAQAPLGTVVTSSGATLYRFDKDTAKPPKSNCSGGCAATWRPLLSSGGTPTVTGVDPALVGTVARDDGAQQVTLGGWPVYKFAKDGPGETNGEGVGGTWHAVGPAGKPAAAAATGAATAPAPNPAPKPESTPKKQYDYGGSSGY